MIMSEYRRSTDTQIISLMLRPNYETKLFIKTAKHQGRTGNKRTRLINEQHLLFVHVQWIDLISCLSGLAGWVV